MELGNQPSLFQVSSVSVDKTANTTTITWREPDGKTYQQTASQPVQLYALRVKAGRVRQQRSGLDHLACISHQ